MIAAGATRLLFLNGIDHALPDANTEAVARALQEETGWNVVRGRLEDYTVPAIASVRESDRFAGELIGGLMTNLLPGVWSSRLLVRLDEELADPAGGALEVIDGKRVRLTIPPHALRSVRIEPG